MPDRQSLSGFALRAAGAAILAILVIALAALAVAWLSPERESILRPWWR